MTIALPRHHRRPVFSRIGAAVLALAAGFAVSVCATEASVGARRSAAEGANADRSASLCTPEETVVFSCRTAGKKGKLLSLCGSRVLDEKAGYIQYRFGSPGKIELEFPEGKENTQSAFRYSRYTRPLVTYLELRFFLDGYRYSIREDYNAEEIPPVKEAFVEVSRSPRPGGTERPATVRCRQPVTGSLMTLEGVVPRSEDEAPEEP
ncbi:hypothetical protein ACWJKU_06520 [Methylocaldum sp. MU1018]